MIISFYRKLTSVNVFSVNIYRYIIGTIKQGNLFYQRNCYVIIVLSFLFLKFPNFQDKKKLKLVKQHDHNVFQKNWQHTFCLNQTNRTNKI